MRRVDIGGVAVAALLLPLLLAGCGKRYELNIVFPEKSEVQRGAAVYVDGIQVGHVERVEVKAGTTVAVAVIENEYIACTRLKPGIIAGLRNDGGIAIDASRVAANDKALPSGTTVEGCTRMEEIIRKYATWGTVTAASVVVGVMLLSLKLLHALMRLGVMVVLLAVSAALAALLAPTVAPLIEEHVYPRLQASIESHQPEGQAVEPPVEKAKQLSTDSAAPASPVVAAAVSQAQNQAINAIRHVPLPDPQWTAFFVNWFVCFILLNLLWGVTFGGKRHGREAD